MKIYQLLGLLGVWVALLPQFGLPPIWKIIFSALTGILIIGVSYVIRHKEMQRDRSRGGSVRAKDTFVEHIPDRIERVDSYDSP